MPAYDSRTTNYINTILSRGGRVQIVSGEGSLGTVEAYDGPHTPRAIATRLSAERAGGDRWAHALIETLDAGMVDGYAVRWEGGQMLTDAMINDVA